MPKLHKYNQLYSMVGAVCKKSLGVNNYETLGKLQKSSSNMRTNSSHVFLHQ